MYLKWAKLIIVSHVGISTFRQSKNMIRARVTHQNISFFGLPPVTFVPSKHRAFLHRHLLGFISGEVIDSRHMHLLQQVLLVVLLIQYHNSIRAWSYLLCEGVVDPNLLPWRKLYDHGDSNSFLHMTGLTRAVFRSLLDYLLDLDGIARHRRRGRPRSLGPDGELGLLLFYLGSTMTVKHLCLIFGVVPSVCRQVINSMVKKAAKLLRSHPMARVAFPNEATMRRFANMVQQRKPSVNKIIGFMDGVSFPVECTDKRITQNAFYCGYDCDTMVNNVFAITNAYPTT